MNEEEKLQLAIKALEAISYVAGEGCDTKEQPYDFIYSIAHSVIGEIDGRCKHDDWFREFSEFCDKYLYNENMENTSPTEEEV